MLFVASIDSNYLFYHWKIAGNADDFKDEVEEKKVSFLLSDDAGKHETIRKSETEDEVKEKVNN